MQQPVDTVWQTEPSRQLAEALTNITDQNTMQNFLRDAMTEKEIIEISSRLEAASMLRANQTYAEIIQKTKLSSRTIARISRWMQEGTGGYAAVLDNIEANHSNHTPPALAE